MLARTTRGHAPGISVSSGLAALALLVAVLFAWQQLLGSGTAKASALLGICAAGLSRGAWLVSTASFV